MIRLILALWLQDCRRLYRGRNTVTRHGTTGDSADVSNRLENAFWRSGEILVIPIIEEVIGKR